MKSARALAVTALDRIDPGGAYANLVLPPLLASSALDERDRHFVTELVYGTTRMRRACDFLVDRFLVREVKPTVRNALRLGAYQLAFLGQPPHAAVGETVAVTPKPARGLVNAVLRRVAEAPVEWPSLEVELSYPDWIVRTLRTDLGDDATLEALRTMDSPPTVEVRDDGYVQDRASQWVADLVEAGPEMRVADLCAGPGGKATAIARVGAHVVAADVAPGRAGLVRDNVVRLGSTGVSVLAADAARPALRRAAFDRVLVDAPCSGLGALRRRPDARWRIAADDVERLAALQCELVLAAADLLAPGGVLVYSACTLNAAETRQVDAHLESARPDLLPMAAPGTPWVPWGRGGLLLPQTAGTDGMFVLRLQSRMPA